MYSFSRGTTGPTAEVLSPRACAERTQSETVGGDRGEGDRTWRHRVCGARRRDLALDHQSGDQGISIRPEATGCGSYLQAPGGAQEPGAEPPDIEDSPVRAGVAPCA